MKKLEIGHKIKITRDISWHGIKIGSIRTLTKVNEDKDMYGVYSKKHKAQLLLGRSEFDIV